jgi:hypothetical protein
MLTNICLSKFKNNPFDVAIFRIALMYRAASAENVGESATPPSPATPGFLRPEA